MDTTASMLGTVEFTYLLYLIYGKYLDTTVSMLATVEFAYVFSQIYGCYGEYVSYS